MVVTTDALSQLKFPVQFLEVVEAFLQSRGASVSRVRQVVELQTDRSKNPAWIDGHQLYEILNIALAHCLPDEPPSLQILRHLPLTALGALGMFSITSDTVGDALDAVLRYHAVVMPLISLHRLADTSEEVHVRLEATVDFAPHNELLLELFIGALRKISSYTTAEKSLLKVSFSHQAVWPADAYKSLLGVSPRFGAESNVFSVPRKILRERLITGSHATHVSLEPQLKREAPAIGPALAARVRQKIVAGLQEGKQLNSESIAYQLTMSTRTLSRRLLEEGTSVKLISEQARMEYVEPLLFDNIMTIREIAERAGFSDASSFIRAYKRATGNTPAAWRQRVARGVE